MSTQTQKSMKIEGTLQGRVLVALVEGPSSGVELMSRLNLRSPGTIYPVLKTLRNKGFIEYAPEKVLGKKMHVLTEEGKEQLKIIVLGISRRFLTRYLELYVSSFVDVWRNLIQVQPEEKILCTLEYESLKHWLQDADVTYLQVLDPPHDAYNHILCAIVGTLIIHGWKRDEFTQYFAQIIKSLHPGGTLVMAEIEKTDNMFAEMFFKDVLGYEHVPGITKDELRELLEGHKLHVQNLHSWRGLLIGVSTKPK